jgi:hypothetical protein
LSSARHDEAPLTQKRRAGRDRRAGEKGRATPGAIRTLTIHIIGGTHLKAAVVDETGHFIMAVRVDIPGGSQPDAIVGPLVRLVRLLAASTSVGAGYLSALSNKAGPPRRSPSVSNSDQTSEPDWLILWRIATCPQPPENGHGPETASCGRPAHRARSSTEAPSSARADRVNPPAG